MSDSDSDDFFFNQNITDEENEIEKEVDISIHASNLPSLETLKNDRKRPHKNGISLALESEEPAKKLTRQSGSSKSSDKNDISDDAESSYENSVISESDDSIHSELERFKEDQTPSINTQDEMFDFLKEVTSNAKNHADTHNNGKVTKRIYNINFISTLEGSQDKRVNVKVTGNKTFESILPITIRTFIQSYKIPRRLRIFYTPAELVLFRAGVEVLPFSNCDSLRIPKTVSEYETTVDLVIVHSADANNYKTEYKRIRESRLQSFLDESNIEEQDPLEQPARDEKFKLFEKELESAPKLAERTDDVIDLLDSDIESSNSIRLTLIDKANKRTSISVWPNTTFTEIANRYKTISSLSEDANVLLIFDNEELNPAATVLSEGLEEDDILEIKIS
ncbi:Esc2p [Kluyveromyces lactis]|uniref:KLLA0E21275p n=1 Tax=Kluyveromyces lactis (strain ATCC 8585 / CBS 2359 / DSM 70799 / NBRC 1267 / NRRL Y-1140 / WM37) TaxID=284590 RepID=Q6CMC6_KLULA|nr:uncharacterized protein KLLA0_E21275g [Kluyveromyces lactis]CAH00000.1 KLLA0E21275p [Kluyveromyces lactis]|eukprot:XP_454913.1 uncharacterized protein KLLA0_E21275g [Kluyveromyces lactis]